MAKNYAWMSWLKQNDKRVARELHKNLRGIDSSSHLSSLSRNKKSAYTEKMIGRAGSVYVFRHGKTNLYKIGYSGNPAKRLKSLQAANPDLRAVFTARVRNAKAAEYIVHKALKKLRKSREFFELEKKQLDWVFSFLESVRFEEEPKFGSLEAEETPNI